LIAAFARKIAELRPRLVTFNGHGFDLPVLSYRAMVNKVSAPGFNVRPYFHRFTEDALDLCDALSSYGSNGKTKLDEICKILGLPGNPEGVNGSNVEQMVAEGRIADVAHYCESDLVNTYLVWLRYLLFSGLITLEQLEWSEAQAAEFINARRMV
jgi:predicted PolB exonuclease-like 3'-5' exonuclease